MTVTFTNEDANDGYVKAGTGGASPAVGTLESSLGLAIGRGTDGKFNRALLSWFLTGEPVFLGGLAQDPGCLNIIDVGPTPSASVVRVVNYCPMETLQTGSRLSTMEHLLQKYLTLRASHDATGDHR